MTGVRNMNRLIYKKSHLFRWLFANEIKKKLIFYLKLKIKGKTKTTIAVQMA